MSQERRRLFFCERRAMSKCYQLLVLVLATACGRTDSAPIDADEHQTCLGHGFTPGTDRICRLQDAPAKITLRSNSYRTMGKRIRPVRIFSVLI
jgi:hypothetical protein